MIDPHLPLTDVMPFECLRCTNGSPVHAALAKAAGRWVVVIRCPTHGEMMRIEADQDALMAGARGYHASMN